MSPRTVAATCAGIAFALAAAQAPAAPPAADAQDVRVASWIGRVDRPAPSGQRVVVGSCIGGSSDACEAAVSVLRDEQSKTHAILATRRLLALDGSSPDGGTPADGMPGGAQPLSLVTDALEAPWLDAPGHELVAGLCQRDGAPDPRIVAVVDRGDDTQWYVRFARLWRLDASGRLQPIPARGVRCLNEGFGYDG